MALVSPGVEVTIIDESQYSSAGNNTVPYILLATAANKKTADGSSLAGGTLASSLDDIYLTTSQRELANTFGSPTFHKTAGGDALHGYELNEYGLMAAYSVLGATNRAYIQRCDIDMAELEASLSRPTGAANDGSYWFDLNDSAFGLHIWNVALKTFNIVYPIIITDVADLETGIPSSTIGEINSYAVVTTNANNPIYWKDYSNAWVLVGSEAWAAVIPTVIGTATSPAILIGDDLEINASTVTSTGTTITQLALDIVGASIVGVTAAVVNSRLEIYFSGEGFATQLTLAEATADSLLTTLGLTAGVFNIPVLSHASHVAIPRWRTTDTGDTRPSGSVWQKTTSVSEGLNIVVKRYSASADAFVEQSTPAYANDQTANKYLDPATGGKAIPVGDTYVQFDVTENNTSTLKIFDRASGETSITGDITAPTFAGTESFDIQASATNSDTLTGAVTVTLTTTTAAEMVDQILAQNITGVIASITSGGFVNITHTGGGVIVLVDTDGALAAAGITASLANVRAGNNSDLILSNWNAVTIVADIVEPGQDPLNGTRWYYPAIDEADIMVHDAGIWKGYRNVTNDIRGVTLVNTDTAGPIFATTAPTKQADGSVVELGDLWIDTSDLENYPVISRYEEDQFAQSSWVLLDNADQTSTSGVLFADARWEAGALTGTVDPVAGDMATVANLLLSNEVDADAPNPALYPDGMLLFNMRRSGYNVKEFRVNYFNADDHDLTNYTLTETNAWVTVSGLKEDGSANFGRLAQRSLVVQALKAAIDTNSDIREEQRTYNLMACPGYPELIPNMVALNNERANTAFIIGDSPLRLPNTGAELAEWATNNGGLGTSTNDGLASNDEYMGVFYPSGRTNDLEGTSIIVPPSHMMLRAIIHSDEQSYPWLAPAGIRRGQIDNVDAIGYIDSQTGEFQQMSTRQGIRDVLYTNNVNPITFIPGAGIVNYGNKTTKTGSALDRINVSRLISYIRVQADALGKQFVFEPNDKLTRDELKGQMERMLNDLIAKRGIYDYIVICDKANNTPGRIDRNELWCDIAIEPTKSGEFLYIPVRVRNTGEIGGS